VSQRRYSAPAAACSALTPALHKFAALTALKLSHTRLAALITPALPHVYPSRGAPQDLPRAPLPEPPPVLRRRLGRHLRRHPGGGLAAPAPPTRSGPTPAPPAGGGGGGRGGGGGGHSAGDAAQRGDAARHAARGGAGGAVAAERGTGVVPQRVPGLPCQQAVSATAWAPGGRRARWRLGGEFDAEVRRYE
jgi:hypothetical protein